MSTNLEDLPEFLRSYAVFKEHLDYEFEGLSNAKKGSMFADLAVYLASRTELGRGFENLEKRKGSYDEGIDVIGETADGAKVLCVQVKYSVKRDIKEIDAIIDDFEIFSRNYESLPKQQSLFEKPDDDEMEARRPPELYFQIVIFTQRKSLFSKYENSQKRSVGFYRKLLSEGRLQVIDGDDILDILQSEYRKTYVLPAEITLQLTQPFIRHDHVYLGIVSSVVLQSVYHQHGDAIFFENIRDFLGEASGKKAVPGRQTVNQAIIETIESNPDQLISRNNGITIKARAVESVSPTELKLVGAGIVNGCQTTMCIVKYARQPCYITTKIVETRDAWEIAKSSNRQNAPDEIDLELARYLRPQVADKVAQAHRVRITREGHTVFNVLETVYKTDVAYDEVKALFVGLFSRSPRNIFDNNYTELKYRVLDLFFRTENDSTDLFSHLLTIQQVFSSVYVALGEKLSNSSGSKEREASRQHVSQIYQRIYKKPSYRAYAALLAASAASEIDISDKTTAPEDDYHTIQQFLTKTIEVIDTEPQRYESFCRFAFFAIQSLVPVNLSRDEISRRMHQYMRDAKFTNLRDRVYTYMLTD